MPTCVSCRWRIVSVWHDTSGEQFGMVSSFATGTTFLRTTPPITEALKRNHQEVPVQSVITAPPASHRDAESLLLIPTVLNLRAPLDKQIMTCRIIVHQRPTSSARACWSAEWWRRRAPQLRAALRRCGGGPPGAGTHPWGQRASCHQNGATIQESEGIGAMGGIVSASLGWRS